MSYAILRINTCKTGSIGDHNQHNERLREKYGNPNIDSVRTPKNYHLIEPSGRYKKCCKDMIERAGCRTRSNSILMLEALVTASPEFINSLEPAEQRLFFERGADFLYGRIGKEHVISAVVHMDETTPHMHFCFCPITEDGRLSASKILGGWRTGLVQWQDTFYEHMHTYYPALERGLPASLTGRKHIPPELFRKMDNVCKCINTVNEQLKGVTIWNIHERRDNVVKLLGENLYDCYVLKARVDELDSTFRRQEESIREKDEEINTLSDRLEETEMALIAAQSSICQLEEEKDRMLELLKCIPPEQQARLGQRKGAER